MDCETAMKIGKDELCLCIDATCNTNIEDLFHLLLTYVKKKELLRGKDFNENGKEC